MGLTAASLVFGASAGPSLASVRGADDRDGRSHGRISHVIVIVQENRTLDNMFHGFPGADTVTFGYDHYGNPHTLEPISLSTQCDPGHGHQDFVTEYNNGLMDGWDLAQVHCTGKASLPDGVFAYVQPSDTQIYWQLAHYYGLSDEVLQMNQGPSWPAHLFLMSGQSGGLEGSDPWAFAENGSNDPKYASLLFCGAPSNARVTRINLTTPFPGVEGNSAYPCGDFETVFDLAMTKGLTWKWYADAAGSGASLWNGPNGIKHLWSDPQWRATTPETRVLTDIANHQLPNVVYVTPNNADSDHPHVKPYQALAGPDWVGSITNAIGKDPYYWDHTTILITWDDWGGWFDHVTPRFAVPNDPYEYGFRVPVVVVSPYVRAGIVDHTNRTTGSILHYIESTFELGSLGTADADSDDMGTMFDYKQKPLKYVPVNTGNFDPRLLPRLPAGAAEDD